MSTDMFRYLEKYVGKYRVLPHLDIQTHDFPRDEKGKIDESFEDLYIPCGSKIEIRHTYEPNILAFVIEDKATSVADNNIKKIHAKYPEVTLTLDRVGRDAFVYFKADDIDKVAEVLKARTSGARIKWQSKRNLKRGK